PNVGELVRVMISGERAIADGELWRPAEVALPEHYKPIQERSQLISKEPFVNNPSYDEFMRLHGIDPRVALESELEFESDY
ncbi:MAG: hypothetical protein K2Z81_12100, partial [Cyanobacteria bacterium]|nr:hypothetical protein [Cyanobacteriota bacterium]